MAKVFACAHKGMAGCLVTLVGIVHIVFVGGDIISSSSETEALQLPSSMDGVRAPPLPRLKIKANSTSVSGFGYAVRSVQKATITRA